MDKEIIFENLSGGGKRMTKARRAIVEILSKARKPLTSAQVLAKLSGAGLRADRSTVYRELCFLVDRKVAEIIKLDDSKIYYEIPSVHHHHLICTKCKSIKPVVLDKHLEEQEREILKKERFKVTAHSLEFYGLCERCAEE